MKEVLIIMWIADGWKEYEVIDTSKGEKLERWGDYLLVRPDPQVIWDTPRKNRGGYKKTLFMLDTAYEHFYFLPNNNYGEYLLRLLVQPQRMIQLNQLLLSDCFPPREALPIEHDGIDSQEKPILLAYDFDMQRINRFNTGLNVYGLSGNLICFDFQLPCLKKYLTADIHFSSIDFQKFKRRFFNEP